ncbi:hypothetical protein GCM10010329_04430 [Streptomyces spiroverticillatus]|uniref:Exo-alpha-sialidase n=1 Tax=Streptomyces finlayi TaxID=67296 RepID=A0A919C7B1_9ACTN|nr:hypothetical protein [Streptomyces finlayi]GGZ87582.1 hypothetical protein GCM10010329_04430 [Streptomyces spiroverticillatus]GHC78759.1 hypothetical protein GCM10010334_04410 [Streptomyces finlayi]
MKAWSNEERGREAGGGGPEAEEPRTLMTLRVSRDSGRTWSAEEVVREGDPVAILENPVRFPACGCVRCVRPARSMRPAV